MPSRNLKLRLLALLCVGTIFGCNNANEQQFGDEPISQALIAYVESGNSVEKRTAYYLLADLILDQQEIELLQDSCAQESESLGKLFCSYCLFKRTQESKYEENFISNFPDDSASISKILSGSTRHVFPGEIFSLLIQMSGSNEDAYRALREASVVADGAAAEIIANGLNRIDEN